MDNEKKGLSIWARLDLLLLGLLLVGLPLQFFGMVDFPFLELILGWFGLN